MVNFFAKYCSLYTTWDINSIAKWEHQKQAGIVKFILVEGVIKWGIFSALIFLSITLTGKEFGSKEVITTCLIWLVASIVYGSSLWYGTSVAYNAQLKTRR
ncbi:hypothetical protein [Thalassotalea hakodatensis]|uniref:hypothetical protein n=1 Tax=Thalassotalea hakodatensis TaxID=3030492 RepID=UPI0025734EBF|nr:hypothetical protein [Thalassotalea hakodatensis]